jgi:hypothetical protein
MNHWDHSLHSIDCKSAITNMVAMRIFKIISDKFNIDRQKEFFQK